MTPTFEWSVSFDDAGQRLDQFILRILKSNPDIDSPSRASVQRWIQNACVELDGCAVSKASKVLTAEQVVRLQIPEPKSTELVPIEMKLSVLFEDADMIVLDKEAGVVVHPGAGLKAPTLVEGLLWHCKDLKGVGDVLRPGIVHRLDRETSGVLVVAKNDVAHRGLSEQFADRRVQKSYWALVYSGLPEESLRLETFYGRHRKYRHKMTSRLSSGKSAVSEFNMIRRGPSVSELAVKIETGRTHQIRVHCYENGFGVVGDKIYGRPPSHFSGALKKKIEDLGRHCLHAQHLSLFHPKTNVPMHFDAPLPKPLQSLADVLLSSDTSTI